ncbi:MAG: hypothetical protein HY885_03370 [Deltaproteobacteria bacterium]|nr:hypothetical protein [Deltaproteobacteria bacterium]
MIRYGYAIVLSCLLLIFFSGCGRKTPPVPPQAVIPAPISDLSSTLDDKGVLLSWTYPSRAESGARISNIRTFRIYKSEIGADNFCAECPVQYGSSIEVNGSGLQPGSTVTYADSALKNHYRYTYKVVSRSGWNIASADSNRISFNWESPLPPPKKLSLQVEEKRLTLNWQPISSLSDGSRVNFPVRYQVYRSEDGEDFSRIAEAVDGRSYSDEELENGRKYFYRVQGVRTVEGTELIGEASEVIAGVPGNVSSLAPPQRFTVVAIDEGVKILWESTPQSDVTGYRVYRRQAGSKKFRLVGEVDKASFSFTDQNLPQGNEILYYVVTAIDAAVPPKESVFSREVEFRR